MKHANEVRLCCAIRFPRAEASKAQGEDASNASPSEFGNLIYRRSGFISLTCQSGAGVLPTGTFGDFLERLKQSDEYLKDLLGHIQRFNLLDFTGLDEGGPDSAPAVFRRLVTYHAVRMPRDFQHPRS